MFRWMLGALFTAHRVKGGTRCDLCGAYMHGRIKGQYRRGAACWKPMGTTPRWRGVLICEWCMTEHGSRFQQGVRLHRGLDPTLRAEIIRRDGGHCRYCGRDAGLDAEIDHVRPVVLGGKDTPDNLVLSCRVCNQTKADDVWIPLELAVTS